MDDDHGPYDVAPPYSRTLTLVPRGVTRVSLAKSDTTTATRYVDMTGVCAKRSTCHVTPWASVLSDNTSRGSKQHVTWLDSVGH